MAKPRDKHPFEDNAFAEGFLDWMDSPEAERSSEALDTVWSLLEKAEVDAKNRKILWEDGQRLSIAQSVKRIQAQYPDLAPELIETHLIGWLEMDYAPSTYSEQQLDELDRLTEQWIEDHERQAEARQTRLRTRHS